MSKNLAREKALFDNVPVAFEAKAQVKDFESIESSHKTCVSAATVFPSSDVDGSYKINGVIFAEPNLSFL